MHYTKSCWASIVVGTYLARGRIKEIGNEKPDIMHESPASSIVFLSYI